MKAPVFDLQPLRDAVGDDQEVMNQVLTMFANSTRSDVNILQNAISKNDGKAVKSTAHHLKGSLLEVGAKDLIALALRLEQLGSAEKLTDAAAVWQELNASLNELIQVLDQIQYRQSS